MGVPGLFDNILRKFISRKLTVFIVSTFALFLGTIDGTNFTIIAVIYMSTQAAEDIFIKIKK